MMHRWRVLPLTAWRVDRSDDELVDVMTPLLNR
jgi:hypothetical protein